MKITLTLLNGSKFVHSSELTSVLIGRSEAAQFRVSDPGLSRQHALIENENGSYFVTDMGSSNGVFIDGQRIEASTKIPFSSFQTLSLGPLECFIAESESLTSKSESPSALAHSRAAPTDLGNDARTRVIAGRKEGRVVLKKSKKNQSSSSLVLIVIVCFVALYFYKTSDKNSHDPADKITAIDPELKPILIPESVPVPEALDEFLSQDAYAERYNKRSCLEHSNICNELALEEKDLEGVLERESEYFIYMKSSKRSNQYFNALDTDPTKADIISLYTIIKSSFYNQLASKKIAQIHLVLFNDENKLYRVYRFKDNHLGKSRMELLKEISGAMTTKSSESFWLMVKEKIPLMDLTL